jgi:hypothetical protein
MRAPTLSQHYVAHTSLGLRRVSSHQVDFLRKGFLAVDVVVLEIVGPEIQTMRILTPQQDQVAHIWSDLVQYSLGLPRLSGHQFGHL